MTNRTLKATELARLSRQLTRDYEAFLAPGERVVARAAERERYLYASLAVERRRRERPAILIEAGASSDSGATLASLERLLRLELYAWVRDDRRPAPGHADWSPLAWEGAPVQLRVVA